MGARWDRFLTGLDNTLDGISRTLPTAVGLAGDIFAIKAAAGGGGKKSRKAAKKAANLRALTGIPAARENIETEYFDDPGRQPFSEYAATPQGKGILLLGGIAVVVLGVALLRGK